ncbi:MAG: transposase [Desulfobacteraceae bacterium]|nr:transposase [Desulfobacteraceae bacterium]
MSIRDSGIQIILLKSIGKLNILYSNVRPLTHEIIGFLKGKCAIKIFDRHLELKKRYWGRHFWAKGYCVSTVGLDEEKIRKYVKWQLEKDKRMEQLKIWQ